MSSASAVAAAGARAGIKTVVFIPSNLEKPKQVNSAVYTDSLVAVTLPSVHVPTPLRGV